MDADLVDTAKRALKLALPTAAVLLVFTAIGYGMDRFTQNTRAQAAAAAKAPPEHPTIAVVTDQFNFYGEDIRLRRVFDESTGITCYIINNEWGQKAYSISCLK